FSRHPFCTRSHHDCPCKRAEDHRTLLALIHRCRHCHHRVKRCRGLSHRFRRVFIRCPGIRRQPRRCHRRAHCHSHCCQACRCQPQLRPRQIRIRLCACRRRHDFRRRRHDHLHHGSAPFQPSSLRRSRHWPRPIPLGHATQPRRRPRPC